MKPAKIFIGISFCFLVCPVQSVFAQSAQEMILPVDPAVRIGKLENGLTYYIRKNSKPENRAEFRLAVNAGSVLEEEDQRGLAHFVEHMAFNGTKNFEKNELIHYLQSIGMKFGPELNAYTSFDETVYMLTIPSDSAEILQKGFQIMEDWAHNLLFDTAEIRKERGVIMEEWRMGRGPFQRMEDEYIPVLLNGSRYAERLPIGKKEVIEGADPATIREFYTDWYRPDLMAFIVVGDIDPVATEQTIKEMFGRIPAAKNPKPRNRFIIPDHMQTLLAVASDKETPYTLVQIACKVDPYVNVTYGDYRNRYLVTQLISSMYGQRLNELKEQADPPVLMAMSYFGSLGIREKDAFQVAGVVPETGIERGIQTLIRENERVLRYGFTQSELDRQKKTLLTSYENIFNERDKTESLRYASEYVSHFLNREPIPGIKVEYELAREYIEGITLGEVNARARQMVQKENRVVIVLAPEKNNLTLPDDDAVSQLIAKTESTVVEPYEDNLAGSDLMVVKPVNGRILHTRYREDLGVTEMKLVNGAKVILKPTDYKNDEVLFRAISPGGYSLYPLADFASAMNASDIVRESGISAYSPSEVNKLLSGRKVNVASYIDGYFEGVRGSCIPKDLESMFQLTYLFFTDPRKDAEAFQSYINRQKGLVTNLLSEPEQYFADRFLRIKSGHNPRVIPIPTTEEIEKIGFDRVFEIYRERFDDAAGFTFFFVGAFRIDSLRPLIETYLASLPSVRREESWQDMGIRAPENTIDTVVYKGNDPKSIVGLYLEGPSAWTPESAMMFSALGSLLNMRYIDVLREEMSGVYGFNLNISLVKVPYEHYEVTLYIPCSPDNADTLTGVALDEIRRIQVEGADIVDVNKVKEALRRQKEKDMQENGPWIGNLVEAYVNDDPGKITNYLERIERISSEELKKTAGTINLDRYVRVVLYPEGGKKE